MVNKCPISISTKTRISTLRALGQQKKIPKFFKGFLNTFFRFKITEFRVRYVWEIFLNFWIRAYKRKIRLWCSNFWRTPLSDTRKTRKLSRNMSHKLIVTKMISKGVTVNKSVTVSVNQFICRHRHERFYHWSSKLWSSEHFVEPIIRTCSRII